MASGGVMGMRFGFLGKIPAQPDFVRQTLPEPIASDFDAWLVKSAQNLALAKAELPGGSIRFLFSAPQRSEAVVGVLVKSRDQVGRSFPLAIYTVVPSAVLASTFHALPFAFSEVFERCDAVLADVPTLSLDALRARVAELVAPAFDAASSLRAASERALQVLTSVTGADLSARAFASGPAGCFAYGMYTFRTAADAARRVPNAQPSAATTVLACPIVVDVDLLAWLDLARRVFAGAGSGLLPSFAWVEEPDPRLLLSLGHASDQLLCFVAEPRHGSARLWPLETRSREAIARAQAELGAVLGGEPALSSSVDELWTSLSRGVR